MQYLRFILFCLIFHSFLFTSITLSVGTFTGVVCNNIAEGKGFLRKGKLAIKRCSLGKHFASAYFVYCFSSVYSHEQISGSNDTFHKMSGNFDFIEWSLIFGKSIDHLCAQCFNIDPLSSNCWPTAKREHPLTTGGNFKCVRFGSFLS